MKLLILCLIFTVVSCGTQVDQTPESSTSARPYRSSLGVGAGGLVEGGEIGVVAGIEGLVAQIGGVANRGFWETFTGQKGTAGAYLILGASMGTVKVVGKVGNIAFTTPNGTISGTYCGRKAGGAIVGGLEWGHFRRSDGALMSMHVLQGGFGIALASECLLVIGLRI